MIIRFSEYCICLFLIVSILVLLNSCNRKVWDHQDVHIAKKQIESLKTGTLVIRVPMQRNKREHLQKLIESGHGSTGVLDRATKQLEEVIFETRTFVREIDSLMRQYYRFSDYLLVPDDQYDALLSGERTNIFMDQNGNRNPEYTLDGNYISLLLDSNYEEKNLVFVDQYNNSIRQPFPKVKSRIGYQNGFVRFLRGFVGQASLRDYREAIQHINYILTRFYTETRVDNTTKTD